MTVHHDKTETSVIKNLTTVHLDVTLPTLCAIGLSLFLTLLLLELHVTMVEHSASHLVDAHLLLSSEAQDINSVL